MEQKGVADRFGRFFAWVKKPTALGGLQIQIHLDISDTDIMAVHIAISFQKVKVIENIVKFGGNPKERFISIDKVYRISSSLRVKVIAEKKVIGPIEPIGPKVARKWPRDINTEMVMTVVAVRAGNFSIGRFCTEFRC